MRIEDLKKPLQNAGITVRVLPEEGETTRVALSLRKKGVKASGQDVEIRACVYEQTGCVLLSKHRMPADFLVAFSDFKIVENTIDTLVKKICATVAYWSAS